MQSKLQFDHLTLTQMLPPAQIYRWIQWDIQALGNTEKFYFSSNSNKEEKQSSKSPAKSVWFKT